MYVFVLAFTFIGLSSKQAQAEDYEYGSFMLTTRTIVNGKPDNLVRVVEGQPVSLQVGLTIEYPSAGIVLNSDLTRVEFRYFPGKGLAVAKIREVGLGIESPYADFNTCEVMRNYTGVNYTACDFNGGRYIISTNLLADGKTIPAGREFLFNVTLDASKISELGLGKNRQNNVAYFRIQPYFLLDFPFEIDFDNNMSFVGKDVYVQFFANQTDLDNASTTRPNIPGYGDITTNPTATGMGDLAKFISNIIVTISQLFITLTYNVFSKIISPMLEGILSIRTYTDQFVNVIYPGWEVLRNVTNIYFIIAIIAIALGTLFRVESYKTKYLLVQLIIAVLTVNFSLVIGQVVLGVADTVQNQFLRNNVEVIRNLGRELMPNEIKDIIVKSDFAKGSFFATASTSLFFLSLAFGAFLVFGAILVFLVIRIVMLWILLMLSPLAYAAGVLPTTKSLRGQWWQSFLKYAFFTPIMAFFLNMAAIIAVNYEYVFRDINTNIAATAEWKGFATLVFAVASNVLLLIFLFAAVNIAQKLGIYGANVADAVLKTGVFAPFVGAGAAIGLVGKAGRAAIGRGFEHIQNVTNITMDPRQWIAGWKEYSQREKQKRLEKRAERDIGIGRWRIKGSAKLGLGGNLVDFYKNFANWQGLKRIGRRLTKSAGSAFKDMKAREKELNLLKKEAAVLSQADLEETTAAYEEAENDFKTEYTRAQALVRERDNLKDKLSSLDQEMSRLTAQFRAATTEDERNRIKNSFDITKEEQARLKSQIQEKSAAIEKIGIMYDDEGNEKTGEYRGGSILGKLNDLRNQLQSRLKKDKELMNEILADPMGRDFTRFADDDARIKFVNDKVKTANDAWMKAQVEYFGRIISEPYHARTARLKLEAEEEKRVAGIKNWPEKMQIFLTAQTEQNPYLAAAALKSLAKDSNFNEVVEALSYDTSAEGLKRFFEEQFKNKFDLSHHHMMEVATEVGYINEDMGWWNMARISGIDKHGDLNWNVDTDTSRSDGWVAYLTRKLGRKPTEEEIYNTPASDRIVADSVRGLTEYDLKWGPQNHEISVEMEKRVPRVVANFARTAFVNQTLGPEGHMTTSIHRAGWKILNSMGKTPITRTEFCRMLRSNTAQAIAMAKEWTWENCRKHGVNREIYEHICQLAGKTVKD